MNEDNTIDYYLKAAWQSAANKYNQIASQFGITQATGYVLINIHKEGTPVSQIANLLGVKTTSLSRILNNLEGLGLIYRETNSADRSEEHTSELQSLMRISYAVFCLKQKTNTT